MTAWAPGRIAIAFSPIPGEALDAWIEGYARRLHTSGSGFLDVAGLAGSTPRSRSSTRSKP